MKTLDDRTGLIPGDWEIYFEPLGEFKSAIKADILEIMDEYASPQIMNNDTCMECNVNFTELNAKLEEYFK